MHNDLKYSQCVLSIVLYCIHRLWTHTATTTTLPAEDGTALYGNGAVVICDKVAGIQWYGLLMNK